MASCYILYSQSLDKFYIGATHTSAEERLEKHNMSYYGSKQFTSAANDWVIFLTITCLSFSQATSIELHIKNMKSRMYVRNLKKYPEMVQKLLAKYKP